jgi:very-short-patch-repair endonuclease
MAVFTEPFVGSIAVAAGLVTADQLRGPGYIRLFRGIFVRSGSEVDFAVRCRAAALIGGGRGVLAGWAAAELLGASCAPVNALVELVLPGGSRRPGLIVRRHVLPEDEIVLVGAARVTTPARTAFDLGRVTPVGDAIMGVDALRYGCDVTVDAVRALAYRHPGVRGGGRLPQVLRRSTNLSASPMESRIRVAIEDAALPLPVLQHRVGPYHLDLAYPELKIAIEYDGREHLKPARALRDLRRQAYLTAEGWTVLRFPASVVLYEPWKIIADLRWLLRHR